MTTTTEPGSTFDPIWEELHAPGPRCRYPFDMVVTFVFRNFPRDKPRHEVRLLEVGCAAGNNLLFAAREGFAVAGIDGSSAAIRHAEQRFEEAGLCGDLRVGDFTELPFDDNSFDLVIDRGSLTCTGLSAGQRAVSQIRRVLRPGGRFLFNPYSDKHTSAASGRRTDDGLVVDISAGTLTGVGQLCFYNQAHVQDALRVGWSIESLEHLIIEQQLERPFTVHAEWRVVAVKCEE